jgi:hypothetical protein
MQSVKYFLAFFKQENIVGRFDSNQIGLLGAAGQPPANLIIVPV